MSRSSRTVSFALCISLFLAPVEGFVVGPPSIARLQSTCTCPGTASSLTTSLQAKKRRRKQQDSDAPSDSSSPKSSSSDLPDFDMKDEEESAPAIVNKSSSTPPPAQNGSPSLTSATSSTGAKITANMMGSVEKPVRSVKELISDRSLEQKFEFDDDAAEDVPDLLEMASRTASLSPPETKAPERGSKRARQDARRAVAQARDQREAQKEENLFSKIPFITDEDGKVKPLKIIETGTWAGIFLLVAWEIYINSPLFERAAPMAPVVY